MKSSLHNVAVDLDIVVCPPFTALAGVHALIQGSQIGLGAQDMHYETEGAFTGEVSGIMIKDLGCRYVILGHSERRALCKESDELVNMKLRTAIKFNLVPIVCVGETLEEREAGRASEVVQKQFLGSLANMSTDEMSKVVIAYEPVWAIGTGKTASPEQAQEMHAVIRKLLIEQFGEDVAASTRILYGGSVKPDNIAELISQKDIDGGLVGGASLKAEPFTQIITNAMTAQGERV